jgi:ligand-binding sensor domain-containing protein/anti-sigma regulatory factor (Ser/Thr protein kinase)
MQFCVKNKITVLLILIGYLCFSQQYPVKQIDQSNGLLNNTTRTIFKDSRGYLWVGTQGGISMLVNDIVVQSYTENDGLAGDFCWDITEDVNGDMWFGSYDSGVTRYDGKNFIVFNKGNGLVDNRVRKLFYYDDHVFIGTDKGISIININTNKIKSFSKVYENEVDNKSNTQIQSIFEYKGKIYVNEFRAGLFEVDYKGSDINLVFIRGYNHIISSKLINGKLYSGHDNFFSQTNIEDYISSANIKEPKSTKSIFWDFEKDHRNNIYAGGWGVRAENGGVFQLIDDELYPVNEKLGIPSKSIVDLYFDEEFKKLYVASLDKGFFVVNISGDIINQKEYESKVIDLIKLNKIQKAVLLDNELLIEGLKSIKRISKQQLFNYRQKNTDKSILNVGHTIELNKKLIEDFSLQHIINSKNTIWLSTNTGVFKIDYDGEILKYIPLQNEVFSIHSNGDLIFPIPYFHTLVLKNQKYSDYTIFDNREEDTPKNVEQLTVINNKTYILDRTNGVYTYDGNLMKKIWVKHGLKTMSSSNDTMCLAVNSGMIYKAITVPNFKIIDSVPNTFYYGDVVNHIQMNNGKIFLATNSGLNIIDDESKRLIDDKSGLNSKNISFLKTYNDTLYVGSDHTFSKIAMNNLQHIKQPKHILSISNLKVNYKDYQTEKQWGYISCDEITLPYNENIISLNFNISGYEFPDKLSYSYNIKGLDEYWSKPTKDASLVIPYLPHGNYTVLIKAIDDSSGNTKEFNSLEINITPPYWKTTWFLMLIIVGVSVLVYIFIKYRTIQIKKKEIEKGKLHSRIVNAKLEALRSQMNPHFTFNAMNSIQNFIVDADIESAMLYLSEFSKLIRTTLEFSTKTKISVSEEIDYLKNYISLENMRFDNHVEVQYTIDNSVDVEETEIVPMVLQPFIENVFEHAFTRDINHPKLEISFKLINSKLLEVSITDNGVGYDNIKTEKIQKSRGVSLVVERLKLIQGTNDSIVIKSSVEGTKIVVKYLLR